MIPIDTTFLLLKVYFITCFISVIFLIFTQFLHIGKSLIYVLLVSLLAYIENTSWKVLAYGIYARVVDVSEIERVRFLIQKRRVRKYRTKHFPCGIALCLLYTFD